MTIADDDEVDAGFAAALATLLLLLAGRSARLTIRPPYPILQLVYRYLITRLSAFCMF